MNRCVMIFAGGTGGHVMPALAVALRLREGGAKVVWVGTKSGLESKIATRDGFEFHRINIKGVRGKSVLHFAMLPFQLSWAMLQSLWWFMLRRPGCILGMGGFVSGPGGLLAGLLRRPLVLHEQNTVAGLTNRHLARLSKNVLSGFPKVDGIAQVKHVGNPVRHEIFQTREPELRLAKRRGALRVLIVGGSLGANVFNEHAPELLSRAHVKVEVLHQCGGARAGPIGERYLAAGMVNVVTGFIDDMKKSYAWCDLAICRAGAITIAELCAAGVPAFLVPYPHAAGDHQRHNAEYLQSHAAARMLPQEIFLRGDWLNELDAMQRDRMILVNMAKAAQTLARPQAAQKIAQICLESMEARHA